MRVFKTKEFTRFARREQISDADLCEAVSRAGRGLVDADLGGGLIKQRIARKGQGRSGGFRTLLVYRAGDRSVFVYGFAKSARSNIETKELSLWRTVAAAFLAMDGPALGAAVAASEVTEVMCDDHGEDTQVPQ